MITPGAMMARVPQPLNSNTPWGAQYAVTLRRIVTTHANNAPRSLQRFLGPSELGSPCDRQVAGKMARLTYTNHVADPWASIMGTAGHMWMEKCFDAENIRAAMFRWVTERRVYPHPDHSGTGDLFDLYESAVVDWKFLGSTTLPKLRNDGPPRRYFVQILLYALGWRLLGLPVKRTVLVAWPRTKSTMDDMYVWDHEIVPADALLIDQVFRQTEARKIFAAGIAEGRIALHDVPATPSDDECYFCPFYRPEAARGGPVGCPGTIGHRPL